MAASGGYWLALAGDEIFSEETSLLGSIGVISASFGFPQLIERLGIERRLHTAGERKSLLDPFLPEEPVRCRTADGLAAGHPSMPSRSMCAAAAPARSTRPTRRLFSGDVLTGRMALDRGLVDGIGELRAVMRARYGDKVRLRPFAAERRRWPFWRRLPFAAREPVVAD